MLMDLVSTFTFSYLYTFRDHLLRGGIALQWAGPPTSINNQENAPQTLSIGLSDGGSASVEISLPRYV
jgi:hypothetical protein